MACLGGFDAWVEAAEEDERVGADGVLEGVGAEVGEGGRGSVAGFWTVCVLARGRGSSLG